MNCIADATLSDFFTMPANHIILLLTPLITAAIGWLTNWIAIRMLFYPRRPIRLLFFKWHGLIPRRQSQLASQAAEIIEREILQQNMLLNEIKKIDLHPYLETAAHTMVWQRIGPQLQAIPLLGGFINESILAKFEVLAVSAMKEEATPLMEKIALDFETAVNLRKLIEKNIAAFDLERLESIVNQVAGREFRTIERIGALLGFFIGCAQVVMLWISGAVIL